MTWSEKWEQLILQKKYRVVYVFFLIVLIPLAMGFNTLMVLGDFQKSLNIALQRKSYLATQMFDVLFHGDYSRSETVQRALDDLSIVGEEFYGAEVLVPDGEAFRVIASKMPEVVGKKVSQADLDIAWKGDQAIAYQTRSSQATTVMLDELPQRFDVSDYWVISKPLHVDGQKQAIVSLKVSSKIIDDLVKDILKKSYFLLILSVLLTLAILMAIVQVFRSMMVYRKEVEGLSAMKSKFIEVVSHQLRTPLSSIRWNLELILSGDFGKVSKQTKNSIKAIYESNANMIHIIDDLILALDIERSALKLAKEKTDVIELVRSIMKDFQHEAHLKNLTFEFLPASKIPSVNLDPKLIAHAFSKILSNAMRYTSDGGRVAVSLKKETQSILFSVQDSGIGIPKDEQSKMFKKFYRGRRASTMFQDASGLGLFISKNIVDGHDGKIWFESEEGKGTTFYIRLPL